MIRGTKLRARRAWASRRLSSRDSGHLGGLPSDDGERGRVGTAAESGLVEQAAAKDGGRHRASDLHVPHDQLKRCPQARGAHQGEVEELRADRGGEREHAQAQPEPPGEGDRALGVTDSGGEEGEGEG